MVRTHAAVALAALLALGSMGCMSVRSPAIGLLYTDVKGPIGGSGSLGRKEGTACAQSFLGLFATGDASIKAAAAAGGIKNVQSIDHHSTNMLGVLGKFCTIVRGS